MSARSPVWPPIASGGSAHSRVVAGSACVAVLALEWAGQHGLRPSIYATFDQLGEPSSYHNLPYDVFGFCVPGVLLVAFGLWLSPVLGRGWLSAGSFALLSVLGASTMLLGILPYGLNSELLELLRQIARTLFVSSPAAVAVLVGAALARRGQRRQALFSILCGIPMAGLVGWLAAVSPALGVINTAPLVVATPWYAGTAVWLVQERILAGRRSRAAAAPFVGVRVLALVAALGLTAYLTDISFPLLPTALAQADGGTQVSTLDQHGLQRNYRVYRPNRLARSPALVVVLHGSHGSGLQAEVMSAFDIQAHRLGWIAAYPDGYRDGWDAYGCCHHAGVDDVEFIASLIDGIESTNRVDPNRVYVTGISRGGMMSYRLGCELASRIAAIAPVAGNMATSAGSARGVGCRPAQPVSVLAIQGTADQRVPIQGGFSPLSSPPDYAPFSEVIGIWRDVDGCAVSPWTSVSGPITTMTWPCRNGSTVETKVIAGGEHDWPGSPGAPTFGPHAAFALRRPSQTSSRRTRAPVWSCVDQLCMYRGLRGAFEQVHVRVSGGSQAAGTPEVKGPAGWSCKLAANSASGPFWLGASVCPTATTEWSVGWTNRLDGALITQSQRRRAVSRPGLHPQAAVDAAPD